MLICCSNGYRRLEKRDLHFLKGDDYLLEGLIPLSHIIVVLPPIVESLLVMRIQINKTYVESSISFHNSEVQKLSICPRIIEASTASMCLSVCLSYCSKRYLSEHSDLSILLSIHSFVPFLSIY